MFVHPEVRFARHILTQLDDLGHVAANRGVFDERSRQATLASNLGMSPRLLSMWLAAWGSRGLVSTVPFALPDVARVELIASINAGIPLHVTLPLAIEQFQEHSVTIGNVVGGTDWTARYFRCLDQAADVRVIWDKPIPSADKTAHSFNCNKEMIGQVVHAAVRLSTRPVMLAVAPASANYALEFTRKTIAHFNDLGGRADSVAAPLPTSGSVRKGEKEHNPFAFVVFAFSCSMQANDSVAEVLTRFSSSARPVCHDLLRNVGGGGRLPALAICANDRLVEVRPVRDLYAIKS